MKKTAVEWLMDKYITQNGVIAAADYHTAKEMEKHQIMQTRQDIYHTGDLDNEQYYNKTFKSE